MVRELLELEPDSKFLFKLNFEKNNLILTNFNIMLLGSRVIFNSETKSLVKPVPNIQQYQNSTFLLESKNLTTIPTPSILLFVSKLNLSNNKLTSMKFLANFIKEIDIS